MPDQPSNFSLKLKELRERAGLTQPQLAEKAAVSRANFSDLEHVAQHAR